MLFFFVNNLQTEIKTCKSTGLPTTENLKQDDWTKDAENNKDISALNTAQIHG